MTDINIIGPHGAGINETFTRPDDTESGFGDDTWFKPCIGNVPETGTKIPAVWLNKVAALFRRAIRGIGIDQDELDDDMLLKCFQKVDKTVGNISTTGVPIFKGMDGTGLIHLLRRVIGINGIAVQLSADGDRVEVDGSGLGGVTFPGCWKLSCRVATTGNIADLTSGAPNIVDGVTLVADDRVLVHNTQTTPAQRGIYRVVIAGSGSNGQWSRATDFDADADAVPGSVVVVNEGTAHADSMWQLFTNAPITLNTTGLDWRKVLPVVHNVFGPSGANHAEGHVPDPGAVAGTAKFLCEDGNWRVPQINVSPGVGSIVVGSSTAGTAFNLNSTIIPTAGVPIQVFQGENEPVATITAGTWRCLGGCGVIQWGAAGPDFRVVYSWQRIA